MCRKKSQLAKLQDRTRKGDNKIGAIAKIGRIVTDLENYLYDIEEKIFLLNKLKAIYRKQFLLDQLESALLMSFIRGNGDDDLSVIIEKLCHEIGMTDSI